MKKLLLALAILVSGCISTGMSLQKATVTDVVDGDTMDIRYSEGEADKLRLMGDTPEKYGNVNPDEFEGVPNTSTDRECLKSWAYNASSYAERLDGENVTLKRDGAQDLRGDYGRLLAYIYTNETSSSFNYRLVKNGYARSTTLDLSRKRNS